MAWPFEYLVPLISNSFSLFFSRRTNRKTHLLELMTTDVKEDVEDKWWLEYQKNLLGSLIMCLRPSFGQVRNGETEQDEERRKRMMGSKKGEEKWGHGDRWGRARGEPGRREFLETLLTPLFCPFFWHVNIGGKVRETTRQTMCTGLTETRRLSGSNGVKWAVFQEPAIFRRLAAEWCTV